MHSAIAILVIMATLAAAWPRSRPSFRPRWTSPHQQNPAEPAPPTPTQPEVKAAPEPAPDAEISQARPSGNRFVTKRVFKRGVEIDPLTLALPEDDGIPWTAGGIYAPSDDSTQPEVDDHVAAARIVEEFLL